MSFIEFTRKQQKTTDTILVNVDQVADAIFHENGTLTLCVRRGDATVSYKLKDEEAQAALEKLRKYT